MRKTVSSLAIGVGILAILGTAFWCRLAMGSSVLEGQRGLRVLALLLLGPLSILPAGILGRTHPSKAAGWLLCGAGAAALWHLGFVLNDGGKLFRISSSVEAWAPLAAICLPMILLGFAFLWPGLQDSSADGRPNRAFRWPLGYGAVTLAAAVAGGVDFQDLSVSHTWTMIVQPAEGPPTTLRLDDRNQEVVRALAVPFEAFFRNPGREVDRKALGSYTLSGPDGFRETYTCVVERKPNGLVISRNGVQFCVDSDNGLPMYRGTDAVGSDLLKNWRERAGRGNP